MPPSAGALYQRASRRCAPGVVRPRCGRPGHSSSELPPLLFSCRAKSNIQIARARSSGLAHRSSMARRSHSRRLTITTPRPRLPSARTHLPCQIRSAICSWSAAKALRRPRVTLSDDEKGPRSPTGRCVPTPRRLSIGQVRTARRTCLRGHLKSPDSRRRLLRRLSASSGRAKKPLPARLTPKATRAFVTFEIEQRPDRRERSTRPILLRRPS